ncbi:Uncharacterised protein [Serratia proteamaculans]|nr:Uncharacterised protein [Serratia proteamaculans]CAI2445197.1 Uncharacterised protein [Serratia proteamaculans]
MVYYPQVNVIFFVEMFNVNIGSLYHSDDTPDGFFRPACE